MHGNHWQHGISFSGPSSLIYTFFYKHYISYLYYINIHHLLVLSSSFSFAPTSDSIYLVASANWNNQTFESNLCPMFKSFTDYGDVELHSEPRELGLLLPDCFWANIRRVARLRITGRFILSGTNQTDAEGNDPLLRLPEQLKQISLRGVCLYNPKWGGNVAADGVRCPTLPNWPAFFGGHSNLNVLTLNNVNLFGPLPGSVNYGLATLNLANNGLDGSIPKTLLPSIGSVVVYTVDLSNNSISGSIPSSLFSGWQSAIPRLIYLNLDRNALSGVIPKDLFVHPSFSGASRASIFLSNNRLEGPLAQDMFSQVGAWPRQFSFSLGNNLLNGTLPPQLFASMDNSVDTVQIDLSGNFFEGPVPDFLTHAKNARLMTYAAFNLSSNHLSGTISPYTLFPPLVQSILLRDLVWDLNNNQIGGNLPADLFSLVSPKYDSITIALSNNLISGPIGSNLFRAPFGSSTSIQLFLSTNQLSGPLPEDLLYP